MKNDPLKAKLLAIDDEPQNLELITGALETLGVTIYTATDPVAGLELFSQYRPQIVLIDFMMPKLTGLEVLDRILAIDPGAEVLLVTAAYSTELAVEAIQKGASDYFSKPIDIQKLRDRIALITERIQLENKALQLDNKLLGTFQFEGMIGRSPAMLEVFSKIRRVAPHFRTILVTGPSGTGKELVARALHRLSPGGEKQFAACNCSALVEGLFESELFGHVRGAFTGATQDKIGLFEYANGGTLFLDEIGEMPLPAQAKLLRVLQNQEIQRVGSPVVRKVDVRIVAATHRDLRAMVAEKRFREDLFYRLSMVEISLPSLSERKEDLPLLQRFLLNKFAEQYKKPIKGLTRRAQNLISRYFWPGNVRELENVLGTACMMAAGETLDIGDLPDFMRSTTPGVALGFDRIMTLEELERNYAAQVLEKLEGNKAKTAEALGISRGSLYRLLSEAAPESEN